MIVYKAENKINGKVYIGMTTQSLAIRKSRHKQESKTKHNKFYSAINKYGFDNFDFIQIDKAKSFQELQKKEIFYINKYDSVKNGYNICYGGQGHNSKYNIYTPPICLECKYYYDCNETMNNYCIEDMFCGGEPNKYFEQNTGV